VELTLVDNHIDHMCREALDAIADMINEGKKPDSIMLLEPEIVEGNSVKSLI
jgi:DNA-binding LacI/PurR family transcriptional regulator